MRRFSHTNQEKSFVAEAGSMWVGCAPAATLHQQK